MRIFQVFSVALVLSTAMPASSAFAWGCLAVARNGAEGWSYNYPRRGYAIERALNECSARGPRCRIVRCDPYR